MTQAMLKRIQDDALAARKARETDKGKFLTTLFSEAAMEGKNDGNRESTDAEVTTVIKKFLKNNKDAQAAMGQPDGDTPARAASRAQLVLEQALLEAYLPAQASVADVTAAVQDILAAMPDVSIKQMGAVMGKLQAKFGDNFDKALASKLVKDAIAARQ